MWIFYTENKQTSWFFRFWSLWPKNEKRNEPDKGLINMNILGMGGGGIFGGPLADTGLAAIAGLALELWVLLEVSEPPWFETALDIGCCMLE